MASCECVCVPVVICHAYKCDMGCVAGGGQSELGWLSVFVLAGVNDARSPGTKVRIFFPHLFSPCPSLPLVSDFSFPHLPLRLACDAAGSSAD